MEKKKGDVVWWVIVIAIVAILVGILIILVATGTIGDVGDMLRNFVSGQNETLSNISVG